MKIAVELYEEGKISAEQIAEALCEQSRRKKKIGQIALEQRVLSMRDTMRILAAQADAPHLPFGKIASDLGLLYDRDVSVLLGEQVRALPSLSSILLELGYIGKSDLSQDRLPVDCC